jgi:hypothetical protein
MEQEQIIKSVLSKVTKDEKEFLDKIFEHPAFGKYLASRTQTDAWDKYLINNPISLKVEDEKANNKEFEYVNLYLKNQKEYYANQVFLYEQLTKDDKALVDAKTQKKIEKNPQQIAMKRKPLNEDN